MQRILHLLLLVILVACQAKGENSGGLVSGHVGTDNKFTLLTPTSGNYVDTDIIEFQLSFPFDVTVTNTPQLRLTVGATTRYADYTSGTGTKTLTFQYPVVAADNDSNGVTVNALQLSGGTMTFVASDGTTTNCDVATVKAKTFAGVKVDNTVPTISALNLVSLTGFYRLGDKISFKVTFTEAVTVDTTGGDPTIDLANFVTGTGSAEYVSGSGTNTLTFEYTIANNVRDNNGFTAAAAITLPASTTIQDSAGLDANLTLPALAGSSFNANTISNVKFNGRVPFVTSLIPPANGTYVAAQNLDFSFTFDKVVTVTNVPRIALTIGATTKYANYISGSGSNTLLFRYTTIPGDTGALTIPNIFDFTGGRDIDAPGNISFNEDAGLNRYTVPATTININAPQPTVTSVAISTDSTNAVNTGTVDNRWIIGQVLEIVVGFNDNVYVNQTVGTPRIQVNLDSGSVYATYVSGGDGQTNLIFRYTIVEGDVDTNGISLGAAIDLNGGTIANLAATNAIVNLTTTNFATTLVDGIRPVISTVTPPANSTYSATTTPTIKNRVDFTVGWSEPVNYNGAVVVPLTVGATARTAVYTSGNNTANILMRYTVATGHNDVDGIVSASPLTGGTVRDLAGNTATDRTYAVPDLSQVFVDTTAATITGIDLPPNDIYTLGETLQYTVHYNENVYVAGGTPYLRLTVGATPRNANYVSGDGTNALVFEYTIVANEVDTNGVAVNASVQVPGAITIRDLGETDASNTLPAMVITGIRVDAQNPTIASVTPPTAGTRFPGNTLSMTVNFSEQVAIDDTGGTPYINVTTDSGVITFNCPAAALATAHTCSHTITAGTFDYQSGLSSATTLTVPAGSTVTDAGGNNSATTFTAPNMTQVRIAHTGLILWGEVGDTSARSTTGAVLNSLTDKSGQSHTMTSSGSPTFAGSYVSFDAVDDRLTIAGTLTNAKHVFIVMRTPALPMNPVAQTLLYNGSPLIELSDDTADIDMGFGVNSSYSKDCGAMSGSGTSFDDNIAGSSVVVLRTTFDAATTFASGRIANSSFNGQISEILIFNQTAAGADMDDVCSYLNGKY